MQKQKGSLIILTGPSGVGKSTIGAKVRQLLPFLGAEVTYTTREPRPRERNGVDYHFVDTQTFMAMVHGGEFLEWAQVYEHYYGNSRRSVQDKLDLGQQVLMVIDVQGAATIRKQFPEKSHVIFLEPDSLSNLERRLASRKGVNAKDVQVRLNRAKQEIARALDFNYVVINRDGHMDETVEQVATIIRNVVKAQA